MALKPETTDRQACQVNIPSVTRPKILSKILNPRPTIPTALLRLPNPETTFPAATFNLLKLSENLSTPFDPDVD
jgi:hypothetical protein